MGGFIMESESVILLQRIVTCGHCLCDPLQSGMNKANNAFSLASQRQEEHL